MQNTLILLRHGKTTPDGNDPISRWVLSDEGHAQAQAIAQNADFQKVDVIISSGERKAFHTVLPLAGRLKQHITQVDELNELNRDEGGFVSEEQYAQLQQATFADMETEHMALEGKWESAVSALTRLSKAIQDIDAQYENKTILICGHGMTLNLYLAYIQDQLDQTYERFSQNSFGDWAVVKDGEVVKDIVS